MLQSSQVEKHGPGQEIEEDKYKLQQQALYYWVKDTLENKIDE